MERKLVKLDFEQRARSIDAEEWMLANPEEAAARLIFLEDSQAALAEALIAVRTMRDMVKPRKLDEALTWRQNDEKAEAMAVAALKLAGYITWPIGEQRIEK